MAWNKGDEKTDHYDRYYGDDDDDAGPWEPCGMCDQGWRHGCCDDMCRGREADVCENPVACECNPNRRIRL